MWLCFVPIHFINGIPKEACYKKKIKCMLTDYTIMFASINYLKISLFKHEIFFAFLQLGDIIQPWKTLKITNFYLLVVL